MHTITECPRCKKDFMYHNTDYHLIRSNMPMNSGGLGLSSEDLEEHDFEYVICQDCDLKEKWLGKEVKVLNSSFEHLNEFKLVVESIEIDNSFPLTVQIGDTDSYEWFQEEELEILNK